jgi:hypothetical protein
MNKNNSRQLIEAAGAKRAALETEIAGILSMGALNEAKLAKLVDTGDLADVSVVGEITACQTLSALLPRRQQLRSEQLAGAEAEILSACHSAISDDLAPRARKAAELARDAARKTLAAHFSDPTQLSYAVENSTLVQRADAIVGVMTIRSSPAALDWNAPAGLRDYASQIIKRIADLTDFEARLK